MKAFSGVLLTVSGLMVLCVLWGTALENSTEFGAGKRPLDNRSAFWMDEKEQKNTTQTKEPKKNRMPQLILREADLEYIEPSISTTVAKQKTKDLESILVDREKRSTKKQIGLKRLGSANLRETLRPEEAVSTTESHLFGTVVIWGVIGIMALLPLILLPILFLYARPGGNEHNSSLASGTNKQQAELESPDNILPNGQTGPCPSSAKPAVNPLLLTRMDFNRMSNLDKQQTERP